jgi:hypothetical protein
LKKERKNKKSFQKKGQLRQDKHNEQSSHAIGVGDVQRLERVERRNQTIEPLRPQASWPIAPGNPSYARV